MMEQPLVAELRDRVLPDAAAALRQSRETILSRWRDTVATILPGADDMTRRQLEDSIPELLDQIAEAMATPGASASVERLIDKSPAHGSVRFHQEISLSQLLIEYHVLRRIMIQEMSRMLGRSLGTDESIAINLGIDVALRQAAIAYADHQTEALSRETSALTKFLSFLSHDLRGGLNGAVLMMEVLRRQLEGEPKFSEAIHDLDVVRRTILDTVGTMERFLHAERLRLRKMPVKSAPFEVAPMLAAIQKGMVYQIKEQDVTIRVTVDPPDLIVDADRQLVTMILQNLISNAIKYGRGGAVNVMALGSGRIGPNVQCRLSISDQGPGIVPEKLNEIFAAFARGETYGQKGVGLGLYIARHASDLLGAKLWAESNAGAGATFHLDLPAKPL